MQTVLPLPALTRAALCLACVALGAAEAIAEEAKGTPTPGEYGLVAPLYSEAGGTYTLSMRLIGGFTTSTLLPANAAGLNAQPLMTGYSFSDGLITLNETNSVICQFSVSTNAEGIPTRVSGYFREVPPGATQQSIEIFEGSFGIQVAQLTFFNAGDACGGAVVGDNFAVWRETRLLRDGFEANREASTFWSRGLPR